MVEGVLINLTTNIYKKKKKKNLTINESLSSRQTTHYRRGLSPYVSPHFKNPNALSLLWLPLRRRFPAAPHSETLE